jgi:lipopolysaccharide/colanic/teichoic acid biosynthesis glycosyltransferase
MPDLIQRTMAVLALFVLLPLAAVIAVAVRLTSAGPVLHRARRIGRDGVPFVLLKFRSMTAGSSGSAVTMAGDGRVTQVGRWLRRTKLDELPQLWNVVRGEMAVVGPRPEDPRYVDLGSALQREVLGLRPGITGPTALAFADEEHRLREAATRIATGAGRGRPTDDDIHAAYRAEIQPEKLLMDVAYVRTRSARGDLRVIGRTIGLVLGRATRP